jgi:predicted amidohydrolase
MKIGYVQFNPVFGQIDKNLTKIEKLIGRRQADILVLPELCTTGYNFISKKEAYSLSETINGRSIRFLKRLSKQSGVNLVAGFCERSGNKTYNSSILIRPNGKTDLYRKTHLFSQEKKWFAPGNSGFKVFSTGKIKIGMMICFDWLFPEAARSLALQGAQVICHPANLVLPYCPGSMPVRALENRIFTVTANRIGRENRGGLDLKFIGQSIVAGPDFKVLSKAGTKEETVSIIEIDPLRALNKSINGLNDIFKDRQPIYYGRLAKR